MENLIPPLGYRSRYPAKDTANGIAERLFFCLRGVCDVEFQISYPNLQLTDPSRNR